MFATQILAGIHGVAPIPVALIALNYRSWLPVILYLGIASLAHALILLFAPLYPLNDQEIGARRSGRRKTMVFLVFGAALLATLGWFIEP